MLNEKIEKCKTIFPEIEDLLIKNNKDLAIPLLQENYSLITDTLLEILKKTASGEIVGIQSEIVLNILKIFMDAYQNGDTVLLADCIGYEMKILLESCNIGDRT